MARRAKNQQQAMLTEEELGPREHKAKEPDLWIDDLVGAICDPIIVWPGGGWENTLPEWVFPDIKMQRLLDLMVRHRGMDGAEPMASDLEVMAYMYPLSLERPLSHDWAEIYLYVATQAMKHRHPAVEVPEDIRRDSLNSDQLRQLNELKRWLHRKRIEARKERRRGEKRAEKEAKGRELEAVPAKPAEQLRLPF